MALLRFIRLLSTLCLPSATDGHVISHEHGPGISHEHLPERVPPVSSKSPKDLESLAGSQANPLGASCLVSEVLSSPVPSSIFAVEDLEFLGSYLR